MNLFKDGEDISPVTDLERQGDDLKFSVPRPLATTEGRFVLADDTGHQIPILIVYVIQKAGMESLSVFAHVA